MGQGMEGVSLRDEWERREAEAQARVGELFPEGVSFTLMTREDMIELYGIDEVESAERQFANVDRSEDPLFGDDFSPRDIRAYVFFRIAGERAGRKFAEEYLQQESEN